MSLSPSCPRQSFVGVAPAPFCVGSLFSVLVCVVAVAVFLSVVFVFPWFASFVKPKRVILFAHYSTVSLTVRTEP